MSFKLGYEQIKNPKMWPYAVLGMLIGITVFSLWLFQIEPVHGFVNPLFQPLTETVSGLVTQLVTTIKTNPVASLTTAVTGLGVFYGLYSKIQSIKATQKAEQLQLQATQELSTMQNEFLTQTQQFAEAKKLITNQEQELATLRGADASKLLAEAQTLVSQKNSEMERMRLEHQTEVKTLQNEIDRLKMKVKEVTVVK